MTLFTKINDSASNGRRDRLRKKKQSAKTESCASDEFKIRTKKLKISLNNFLPPEAPAECTATPLPRTLPKTTGDTPAAGDDFFPDSEDRDLSIAEVSAPMDATNKSYGRFKLSFFKTFLVTPIFL